MTDYQNLANRLLTLLHSEMEGKLEFERKGRGKVVGAFHDTWSLPVRFRIRNGALQYKTPKSGWPNHKYGDPLSLLSGDAHQNGLTSLRVANLEAAASDDAEGSAAA